MNEQEWLECKDPQTMLRELTGESDLSWKTKQLKNISDRKLRLFACACARMRGCVDESGLSAYEDEENPLLNQTAAHCVDGELELLLRHRQDSTQLAVALLREIVDNPFRLAVLDKMKIAPGYWRLAREGVEECYAERWGDGTLTPWRLSILADCLEDGGCTDEAILTHLRSADPTSGAAGRWIYY